MNTCLCHAKQNNTIWLYWKITKAKYLYEYDLRSCNFLQSPASGAFADRQRRNTVSEADKYDQPT